MGLDTVDWSDGDQGYKRKEEEVCRWPFISLDVGKVEVVEQDEEEDVGVDYQVDRVEHDVRTNFDAGVNVIGLNFDDRPSESLPSLVTCVVPYELLQRENHELAWKGKDDGEEETVKGVEHIPTLFPEGQLEFPNICVCDVESL